jgi:hypothetical protein
MGDGSEAVIVCGLAAESDSLSTLVIVLSSLFCSYLSVTIFLSATAMFASEELRSVVNRMRGKLPLLSLKNT